ncbi:MAG: tetratricopeptide repeat protein, partial [Anaerolineales bacterium]
FSLHGLGFAANGIGEHAQAGALFTEAVELAREIDDQWLLSFALHFLAIGTSFQGDLDQARAMFEENIQINQSGYGNAQGIGFSLFHLGRIARLQGRYDQAAQHQREGLALFAQIADRRGLGYMLAGLACLAFAQEELKQAAYLFGVVDAIRGRLGNLLEEILQAEYQHAKRATQQILAAEDYQAAYQEGKTAALEQVIRGVLGDNMA